MQQPVNLSWDQDPHVSDQAPVQRLSRLPAARRRRLAARTGAPYADAASLVDHLSRPSVARGLFAELTAPAQQLARLFVEAVEPLPLPVLQSESTARMGEAAARAALDELERAGLVVRLRWAGGAEVVGMVPPLTRSGRSYLWLLGDEREPTALPVTHPATRASVQLDHVHLLATALAALATDPPRILRDGLIHSADLAKLAEERFGAQAGQRELKRAGKRLVDLGIVSGLGGRARVVWWRAEAFFRLPRAARLPALLATDPGRPASAAAARIPGLASAEHVRRLLAAALLELPAGHWARRGALEGAVRMRILATDAVTPYTDPRRAAQTAGHHVRSAVQAMLPAVEVHEAEGGETWLRLPLEEEGRADAGWLVQPTHEIMVPPEVRAGRVVALAQVADLVRADVMATFRIDPRSVARAAGLGLDASAILQRLGEGAAHGLPPTLEVQVAGWLRQANPELYGLPAANGDSDEETPSREVPVHRRPAPLPLPSAPSPQWSRPVARFRREALERLHGPN